MSNISWATRIGLGLGAAMLAASFMLGTAQAKTCKGTVSIASSKKITNIAARINAKHRWRSYVAGRWGNIWSFWVLASNKRYDCRKTGPWYKRRWICVAKARPCRPW